MGGRAADSRCLEPRAKPASGLQVRKQRAGGGRGVARPRRPSLALASDMSRGEAPLEEIRLLVTDVDGTLVRDDKSLPEVNRDAILELAAAGVATTLISSRPPSGMLALGAALRLAGPFAAFNGGTLFEPDGTIRFAHRLEAADAAAMLRLIDKPGVTLWVYADGAWFAGNLNNPHVVRERLAAGIEPVIRTDFAGLGG